MKLKWTDIYAIAEELYDRFPEVDPLTICFTDLHQWVLEIEGFDDDAERSGEKVLEAIQMAWLDEWKTDNA